MPTTSIPDSQDRLDPHPILKWRQSHPIDGLDARHGQRLCDPDPAALRRALPGVASNEKCPELRQGHVLGLFRPLTASTRTCPGVVMFVCWNPRPGRRQLIRQPAAGELAEAAADTRRFPLDGGPWTR